MKSASLVARSALALSLVAAASCGDVAAPTAVQTESAAAAVRTAPASSSITSLLGQLLGQPTAVEYVKRATPLAADETTSRTIGFLGGRMELPNAGGSIYFPPGALLRNTKITMTAVAGDAVAYEFQPHGIKFLVPPVITQQLKGTTAGSTPLMGAYFADRGQLDLLGGVVKVTELLDAVIHLRSSTVSFPVGHFSGYVLATGRSGRREAVVEE